jgi:broad-specificity NMP kinase
MKKYWLTGVSGTGKTTIGVELAKRGYYVIDVEEAEGLCAWWSNESNKFVDFPDVVTADFSARHQWRLDVDKLEEMIDIKQSSVIVVGMNDTLKLNMNVFEKVFISGKMSQCSKTS